MNITLVQIECKPVGTFFCPLSADELATLQQAGVIAKRKRLYHMVLNYQDIQVECPVQLDGKKQTGIILPAFKLPYRKYPVFVYLYAIALYLTGTSMRKAARITGEKFGIPKFSHSTVSRTLDTLTLKVDELATICLTQTELPQAKVASHCTAPATLPGRPPLIERPRWKDKRKQAAPQLLKILSPILLSPESGTILAHRYFTRYGRFLL